MPPGFALDAPKPGASAATAQAMAGQLSEWVPDPQNR
jgi:hypothetical protein